MTQPSPAVPAPARIDLVLGILYALAAGLVWGIVFVGPLLLAEYTAPQLALGRYTAFGLFALSLSMFERQQLRLLTRADWVEALKLAAVGNLLYYFCLAAAIQRAGGPLPTMILGTLPVVIAIWANRRDAWRDGHLPWAHLAPSLVAIGLGIACVNQGEWTTVLAGGTTPARYLAGALFALVSLACWTWYPLRNADWLRHHPGRQPRAWATAQGVVTLPLALLGYGLLWAVMGVWQPDFPMPLGPRPGRFLALIVVMGILASWVGTLCWNEASKRLPSALVGQLIIFETLAALGYNLMLRGKAPPASTLAGIALLIGGVVWTARITPEARLADEVTP